MPQPRSRSVNASDEAPNSAVNGAVIGTSLSDRLNNALPQTQCTRCGFPDCRAYAEAIACGEADINRCPPGGTEGVLRLAHITGRPALPLDPHHGAEGPRWLAIIEEAACIGCTLCIDACPVDAIVGAPKRMHTIIASQCTGCELCVPACPVDCIVLADAAPGRTGWQAWGDAQAKAARARYARRRERTERVARERDEALAKAKVARARTRAAAGADAGAGAGELPGEPR